MESVPSTASTQRTAETAAAFGSAQTEYDEALRVDGELLHRAFGGEHAALETLYEHFNPHFYHYAGRLLRKYGSRISEEGMRTALEDLVHSIWVHVLAHREEIQNGFDASKGTLHAYFMGLARNQIISQLRSPERRGWLLGAATELPELPAAHDPETQLAAREKLSRLASCLEHAGSAEDVGLFRRVVVEDEDIGTIAAEQGMQRNALYKRISRVRQRLHACMEKLQLSRRASRR